MASRHKTNCCDYCGEPLGQWLSSDEPITCGQPECERWARNEEREAQLDLREIAERDGYERYR